MKDVTIHIEVPDNLYTILPRSVLIFITPFPSSNCNDFNIYYNLFTWTLKLNIFLTLLQHLLTPKTSMKRNKWAILAGVGR